MVTSVKLHNKSPVSHSVLISAKQLSPLALKEILAQGAVTGGWSRWTSAVMEH